MCLRPGERLGAEGAALGGIRGVVTVAVSLAALSVATGARAQHVEYRASATLTGAYTQSISDSPYPTALTFSGPSISISPQIVGLVDTPRTENSLTYAFTLSAPFAYRGTPAPGTAAVTYSNRFTYAGRYALSELTTMTLGAGVTQSPLNTFVASQDPSAAPIQTVPTSASSMITANVSEGFSRIVSDRNNFAQTGAFLFNNPIDPTSVRSRTYTASNNFTFTHVFPRDSLGVGLTDQLNYFTASQPAATDLGQQPVTPASSTWVNTLAVNWTHVFSEAWSTTLIAGATQTLSPSAATFMQVQPTGSVGLSYNFLLGTAGLSYAHQAAPNVSIGTVEFTDSVNLRFAVPIGVSGFVTSGTLGYAHGVPLGTPTVVCLESSPSCAPPANLTSPSNVFLGDLLVEYRPPRAPSFSVGLRGQVTRQILTQDVANSFTRYTIALNLTYAYPNVNAAVVRPQLSPLRSAAPPAASEVISTDRFFSAGVAGPAPAEPLPKPKGP